MKIQENNITLESVYELHDQNQTYKMTSLHSATVHILMPFSSFNFIDSFDQWSPFYVLAPLKGTTWRNRNKHDGLEMKFEDISVTIYSEWSGNEKITCKLIADKTRLKHMAEQDGVH